MESAPPRDILLLRAPEEQAEDGCIDGGSWNDCCGSGGGGHSLPVLLLLLIRMMRLAHRERSVTSSSTAVC